jgi:2-oxoisovalerate dehydrogenase E2 component (dihydrolipoyl transacylase)
MGRFSFKLPDVGEGIAEAEIVTWHVKVGDLVQDDQPLVDVMTDKATIEITSPVTGKVLSIQGEPGEQAAIGSIVAVFETDAADKAGEEAPAAPAPVATPAPAPAAAAPAPVVKVPEPEPERAPQHPAGKALASPAVRLRAKELGIDLDKVPGSGAEGRIRRGDLEAYAASRTGGGAARPASTGLARRDGTEQVKVIGLRRRIADKMAESKRRIPHFYYVEEIDVTELERLRTQINAENKGKQRLTVLPFLIRALTKVLPEFPQINATYDDEAGVVTRHSGVHMGVATQTDAGLMVPVIRHAESLTLWQLAAEVVRLAEAARSGKAAREELSGSTITLTSLGPKAGIVSGPVINHPEVAIVCPNKIVERPMVFEGQIAIRKMMNLSGAYDHRVVDGSDAAEFVQRLKRVLETPALLFMDEA